MIQKSFSLIVLFLLLYLPLFSQPALDYYLPDGVNYDPSVPKPAEVIGHQVGEWHVTHDKLVYYMRAVAEASDRVNYQEYAYTYEDRPLVMLTISAPGNHDSMDKIKENHQLLTDSERSSTLDIGNMPVIINLGYSVHGNEPSGSNAAMVMAYHLAAAQGSKIEEMLDNAVILLDPSLNPDGLHRFATWVNMHKSKKSVVTDPFDREYNEVWPGGRTNHYWFDLNRDWLLVQHPSSRGRVKLYQEWMPNVLGDFHEMGKNSTYFFQPGVPSRTNPHTPESNQELTMEIAQFHARELEERQELYYTREGFDDFYYGKASTYPDVFGTIGILFEQASSRGHAQESIHGVLKFPETIKNQVTTSFSTLNASLSKREELLDHMRTFYQQSMEEASQSATKGIVVGAKDDKARTRQLGDLLSHHDITFYNLANDLEVNGKSFGGDKAYVIPMEQPRYKFIKALFERRTSFTDSLFYDVSTWTMPYAFNLPFAELNQSQYSSSLEGEKVVNPELPEGKVVGGESQYAYLFEWDEYYAPRTLYRLQDAGVRTKVASKPFRAETVNGVRKFDYGTIMVALGTQDVQEDTVHRIMETAAQKDGLQIYNIQSGLNPSGIDLGSPSMETLNKPEVAILGGSGISSNNVGEIWHLFDQRFHMPVTIIEKDHFSGTNLNNYNVIIMVNGNYGSLSSHAKNNLKNWVEAGGTLILIKHAVNWAANEGLTQVKPVKKQENDSAKTRRRPYADLSKARGAQQIGGSIFHGLLDLTHPLGYGYNQEEIPIFRNSNNFMQVSENPYATPLKYREDPLASGYISDENLEKLSGTAGIIVSRKGGGNVVSFSDNPAFRAFWFGTNKLLMNAVFFGHTISGAAGNRSED